MLEYLNIWFLAFLFAGVVINPVKVIWPLRVLAYVFPFRWGFAAITYTEFYPTHWSGAISCPLGYERGEFPPGCGHNGTGCMGDVDSGGLFCCSDIAPKEAQLCHGHTGAQVLDSLHTAYKVCAVADQTAGPRQRDETAGRQAWCARSGGLMWSGGLLWSGGLMWSGGLICGLEACCGLAA